MKSRLSLAASLLTALSAATITAATAHAQTPMATSGDLPPIGSKEPSRPHQTGRRLALVVKQMSQDSGAAIECDNSVASEPVPPPAEPTTAANFESQIDALVAKLPKGTTWAKLYMPDIPAAHYKPDDLADYAMAESRLFGVVGGALPQGTIEVLGQKLSADKAASVGAALNLKPIYIITNTLARRQTPKQRAQAFLAMTPDQRQAAIGDMMRESTEVMREMFSAMSPEERQQMAANGMRFNMPTPGGGQAAIMIRSKDDGNPPSPPNP